MRAHTNPRARAFAPAVHHPEIECRIRSRIDRTADSERYRAIDSIGGEGEQRAARRQDATTTETTNTMMMTTSVTNAARARAMPTKRVEVRTRAR